MMNSLRSFACLLAAFWGIFACTNDPKIVDSCGDGIVDPGEECDQSTGGQTCGSLGHYSLTGTLRCGDDCLFDRDECGGRCGDNLVEPLHGESCDLTNLNGASCVSLGFSGGTLACAQDCNFDTAACVNLCGNGIRDTGEACDDSNNEDGDGCSSACVIEHGWTCDGATPNQCTTSCGDGIVAGTEECDLEDFGGATCATFEYHAGELVCTEACTVVIDGCVASGSCGDGTVQDAYEDCDGDELDGGTCQTQDYYGGTLACSTGCAYDTTDCQGYGRCGDGLLQDGYGEDCDGVALGIATCQTLGFYDGALACDMQCGFDTADCQAHGYCGDGAVQGSFGESCDGSALDGDTCLTLGHYDGVLACDGLCAFDFSACGGRCGDNVLQAGFGEVCDQSVLGGRTCRTEVFFTGALVCSGGCDQVVTAGCLDVAQFEAGYHHACAVLTDGTVHCWGKNLYGQVGDGTLNNNRTVQTRVSNLGSVTAVTAGGEHTCALLDDGSVRCWGRNLKGQLGDGTLNNNRTVPVPVTGLTTAVAVTTGSEHTCALQTDGNAVCWGAGGVGQLGDGNSIDAQVPVPVSGLVDLVAIDAGESHTCALKSDNTLWCWGYNNYGQLGDNTNISRPTPVQVVSLPPVTSFRCGRFHTCALSAGGTPSCWGWNQNGQLGIGSTTNQWAPTTIPALTGVVSISGGATHTCVVLSDGTGRCWGYNNHGQLGDGTFDQHTSPIVVSELAAGHSTGLGYEFSCARVDGAKRIRCWGWNQNGQLGDGTLVGRTTPGEVLP